MAADDRGTQVSLAYPTGPGIAFHLPDDPPEKDDDIIDHEEVIARLERYAAPLRSQVQRINGLVRQLRGDITKTMLARTEEPDHPLLDGLEDGESEAA